MSFCVSRPRFGTLPSEFEKDNVSVVRLSSRTFSLGGLGIGGPATGLVNVVVVGAALFGRKIKLKPRPAKSPWKLDKTPNGGVGVGVMRLGSSGGNGLTSSNRKLVGRTMVGVLSDISWSPLRARRVDKELGTLMSRAISIRFQLQLPIVVIYAIRLCIFGSTPFYHRPSGCLSHILTVETRSFPLPCSLPNLVG